MRVGVGINNRHEIKLESDKEGGLLRTGDHRGPYDAAESPQEGGHAELAAGAAPELKHCDRAATPGASTEKLCGIGQCQSEDR